LVSLGTPSVLIAGVVMCSNLVEICNAWFQNYHAYGGLNRMNEVGGLN